MRFVFAHYGNCLLCLLCFLLLGPPKSFVGPRWNVPSVLFYGEIYLCSNSVRIRVFKKPYGHGDMAVWCKPSMRLWRMKIMLRTFLYFLTYTFCGCDTTWAFHLVLRDFFCGAQGFGAQLTSSHPRLEMYPNPGPKFCYDITYFSKCFAQ